MKKRASKARKACIASGTPNFAFFKAAIRTNLIRNNTVTAEDIQLAEKAYGNDLGGIKSKSTRSKPEVVKSQVITIPDELLQVNEEITLSIDGLNVNGLEFLTTISHDLYYRSAARIMSTGHKPVYQRIQEIYLLYKRYGFHVTEIRSDKQFKKALEMFRDDQLQKYQTVVKINIANTKEHVPHAERNNRTIQDRTRCDYFNMPYTHLPRTLVEYMVMESSKKLNFFPTSHGIY